MLKIGGTPEVQARIEQLEADVGKLMGRLHEISVRATEICEDIAELRKTIKGICLWEPHFDQKLDKAHHDIEEQELHLTYAKLVYAMNERQYYSLKCQLANIYTERIKEIIRAQAELREMAQSVGSNGLCKVKVMAQIINEHDALTKEMALIDQHAWA